ncbi:FtsW/RodA/SpoVE family cell cycle protein [Adlercreutzia aquisgranensis]|uniref:FtsW/RodA/SpoVE family cell cycle protein n=1 Tax=Adlercreutzia aquisgranensis TaxID=2941323 RepID=UPI00203B39CD|nr:FtsW/RodA/SpoVE family cell cycle protein [Adlercreutzia aquisgranensis]
MSNLPQIHSVVRAAEPKQARQQRTGIRRWVNLPFLLVILCLVGYGLVIVYSAVSVDEDYSFTRQLQGVAAGLVAMAVVWRLDYRHLSGLTMLFLVINVVLILSPHIPGLGTDAGMGAKSWIRIGMQVQPGEFAKITVVLLDASVMARYGGRLDDPKEYCKALGIMLVPFLCIMTQPDLGTGLVYLFIGATAMVVGGARPKFMLITLAAAIVAFGALMALDEAILSQTGEYKILKEYQRKRLFVFMNQDGANLSEEGYNLKQAQIAIGSGGLFGKGLFQGSQHALGLLPEAPTDFIFCVLAEELGFFGVMVLLLLYVALILLCFRIAASAGDMFGMVIVMSVVGMWLFQILESIGMDCGLMPITGIPLPFVSYGSSFMVVNFVMLGLIGSVWSHSMATKRS